MELAQNDAHPAPLRPCRQGNLTHNLSNGERYTDSDGGRNEEQGDSAQQRPRLTARNPQKPPDLFQGRPFPSIILLFGETRPEI